MKQNYKQDYFQFYTNCYLTATNENVVVNHLHEHFSNVEFLALKKSNQFKMKVMSLRRTCAQQHSL